MSIDGFPRWDVLVPSVLNIDTHAWVPRRVYADDRDGLNGTVCVVHTPNHRAFKGTEYIVQAIEKLKDEGWRIDLRLIEGVQNDEVRRLLTEEADILVEQLLFNGYAMSGLEGMASGIPVVSNLSNRYYTRPFRRYSFLDECPIASATIESVKDVLRTLIADPALRRQLGQAGRRYVEKYHSLEAARFLFNKIYDRIWYERDVDLLTLFHPDNSASGDKERISHPLICSQLPVPNEPEPSAV